MVPNDDATLGIDDELEVLRAWGVFVRDVRVFFGLGESDALSSVSLGATEA